MNTFDGLIPVNRTLCSTSVDTVYFDLRTSEVYVLADARETRESGC